MDTPGLVSFPAKDDLPSDSGPDDGTSFYSKVRQFTSVASTVMQTVLPTRTTSGSSVHSDAKGLSVDAVDATAQVSRSPSIRYLSPTNNHLASKSTVSLSLSDMNTSQVSLAPSLAYRVSSPESSRPASVWSANSPTTSSTPQMQGLPFERDGSSDSESVVTSSTRNYMMANFESRLHPLRSGGLSREFWMKDESAAECFKCARPFTAWRRKHHCRICGQILCSNCTTLIPGRDFNVSGKLRTCLNCLEFVDAYGNMASSESETEDTQPRNATPPPQPQPLTNGQPLDVEASTPPTPAPVMAIPTTRDGGVVEVGPGPANSTGSPRHPLHRRTSSGVFVTPQLGEDMSQYSEDAVGSDFDSEEEEDERVMSLFASLQGNTNASPVRTRLRSGTAKSVDRPNLMMRPSPHVGKKRLENVAAARTGLRHPSYERLHKHMGSKMSGDFSVKDAAPLHQHRHSKQFQMLIAPDSTVTRPDIELNKASIAHARALLGQLLVDAGLGMAWSQPLLDPLISCCNDIDLDVKGGDNIDIRHYVKIKRIAGGAKADTQYLNGILFTKTLANRRMPRRVDNPRVLLLAFPIEYTRSTSQHQYMTLDPVIVQEQEFVRKLVSRIVSLEPHVILASETVCVDAVEMLAQANIALAMHVSPTVLTRMARYTSADIITSIDKLAMSPKLGRCQEFMAKAFRHKDQVKHCLSFSGIPKVLGCTLILRGADMTTLNLVKTVVEFMVSVVFHLKLETSLMRDQFALVPSDDTTAGDISGNCTGPVGKELASKPSDAYFSHVISSQATRILSSSPFVQFGLPFQLMEARRLEDELVMEEKVIAALDLDNEAVLRDEYGSIGLSVTIDELPDGMKGAREIVNLVNREKLQVLHDSWTLQKRQWEASYKQSPLMFSPTGHQSVCAMYSLVSSDTATPCVGPELLVVDFYNRGDCTLGQYVEQCCFRVDEPCPDGCGKSVIDHYASYVCHSGRVNVVTERFPCKIEGLQDTILMWSYCKQCKANMPVVPMSSTTWKYSYGKYLELSFYRTKVSCRASVCNHDLYRDHIRYFGYHDLAVRFEYEPIDLLQILAPRPIMRWSIRSEIEIKASTYKAIAAKVTDFYESVRSRLGRVILEGLTPEVMEQGLGRIERLKQQCQADQSAALEALEKAFVSCHVDEVLPLNAVVRDMQEAVVQWDSEFQSFEKSFLPSEKDITAITSQQLKRIFLDKPDEDKGDPVKEDKSEKTEKAGKAKENMDKVIEEISLRTNQASGEEAKETEDESDRNLKASTVRKVVGDNKSMIPRAVRPPAGESSHSASFRRRITEKLSLPSGKRLGLDRDDLELLLEANGSQSKVSSLAKHFDQLSKDFEKERARERNLMAQGRARVFPVAKAKPIVEVFENVEEAVEAKTKDKKEDKRDVKDQRERVDEGPDKTEGAKEEKEEKKEEPKEKKEEPNPERQTLLQTLARFWADRSATGWSPLKYPLDHTEHVFADSDVIVREDEPSSLIAFCLSSQDYMDKMASADAQVEVGPGDSHEYKMLRKTGTHLKYQIQEGSAVLSCKIFFSEQFDAFRKHCRCDKYVQSLSRCIKWDSSGGKSGSAFLKTLDDRLVVKQLSPLEMDAFTQFAPTYFEYMGQAFFHDLPTAMAKVFGFYEIQIRNPISGRTMKMDLIVMENLFYGRKMPRIFDLKGSMRNRHVQQTGRENEVLLDENMVEYIYESPLFVRASAKRMLKASLFNDTLFLAKMNVMDYSLVIGVDEIRRQLVVGIIDFIRTFTWDKKLESWVKERGLVGGGQKEPTVVSPRQYKNRFREAMDRYLIMVPDCWFQE